MKNTKMPTIRFKGFNDDWEQRKLGELSYSFEYGLNAAAKEYDGENKYIRITDIDDNTHEFLTDNLTSPDIALTGADNYKLTEGDILFARTGASVGKSYIYKNSDGLVYYAGFLIRARIKEEYDAEFVFQNTLTDRYNKYIAVTSQRSGQPGVNAQEYAEFEIKVPKKEEQTKIGTYFRNIDHLITLHQRKLEKIKLMKKSMLGKMFSRDAESIPKIRFDGYTDDWEQRKFGDLADYKKGPFGSALKKDIFVPKSDTTVKVYEQQNAINKDWHLERYFITEKYANKLSGFRVEGGDIIVSCAGTIGETYELPMDAEPGIINQALMKIKVKESIVNKKMFNILFTNMIDDFTRVHSNGSAIKNIPPFSDLKPMEVFVPEIDEQNKISFYFSNLDRLITLHQRKLEKLKKVKKSLLEHMFPTEK